MKREGFSLLFFLYINKILLNQMRYMKRYENFKDGSFESAERTLADWLEPVYMEKKELPEHYSGLARCYSTDGIPDMSAERLTELDEKMRFDGCRFITYPMAYRGKNEYMILVIKGEIRDFVNGFLKAAKTDTTERWAGYAAYFDQFEVVGEDDELDEQLEDIMDVEFEITDLNLQPQKRGVECNLLVKTPAVVGSVDQHIQVLNDIMDHIFGTYFVTFDLSGIERTNKDW